MSIFDYMQEKPEYVDEKKHREFNGHKIMWEFVDDELFVSIDKSKGAPVATIDLNFLGGVTTNLKRIKVDAYRSDAHGEDLTLMWNEIHRAISEYTTYDSLMPLYGHFTESYPKFVIKFSSDSSCEAIQFQKVALDEKYRTKIFAFSKFPIDVGDYEEYFARMRSIGFDVRTNQTNRTVPLEHFRICYPFTLPSDWKNKTEWE